MPSEFKGSPYWQMFADVVQFMRENYPVRYTRDYPDQVVQSYERYCGKYRGNQFESFFCSMASYVVYELDRFYYEEYLNVEYSGKDVTQ